MSFNLKIFGVLENIFTVGGGPVYTGTAEPYSPKWTVAAELL